MASWRLHRRASPSFLKPFLGCPRSPFASRPPSLTVRGAELRSLCSLCHSHAGAHLHTPERPEAEAGVSLSRSGFQRYAAHSNRQRSEGVTFGLGGFWKFMKQPSAPDHCMVKRVVLLFKKQITHTGRIPLKHSEILLDSHAVVQKQYQEVAHLHQLSATVTIPNTMVPCHSQDIGIGVMHPCLGCLIFPCTHPCVSVYSAVQFCHTCRWVHLQHHGEGTELLRHPRLPLRLSGPHLPVGGGGGGLHNHPAVFLSLSQ